MNEIERHNEREITCPYCGYEFSDSWEYGMEHDGDTDEEECPECDKKFYITMNVEVGYSTKGLCKENKTKHNWKHFDHVTSGKRCKGKKCLVCGEYEFEDVS